MPSMRPRLWHAAGVHTVWHGCEGADAVGEYGGGVSLKLRKTEITRFITNLLASFYAKTEADTRAKTLIYLVENGLCTLEFLKGV